MDKEDNTAVEIQEVLPSGCNIKKKEYEELKE